MFMCYCCFSLFLFINYISFCMLMDEVKNDPNRGFAGGYYMQTLPGFGLGWYANNVGAMSVDSPGKWGKAYASEVVENYRNSVGWPLRRTTPLPSQDGRPAA